MTSAGSAGFAGAKAGLGAISQQTQWMSQQVSAGKLALDPEAAEAAAKHCEDEIRELAKLARDAQQLSQLKGLGDYPSGQYLTESFKNKAQSGGAGAMDLIREMQEKLKDQAEAFRAAAKDYRATDEQIADDMQGGMQQ